MLFPLYQILIYGIVVLSQLRQFWNTIQSKLVGKSPYTVGIKSIRMRLPKLQNDIKEAKKLRSEGLSKG